MATINQSVELLSIAGSSQPLNDQIIQNFHLVWLDSTIDEKSEQHGRYITDLRQIVNTIHTFVDVDGCIDFITDTKEKAFVIISGQRSQTLIPIISHVVQVSNIYIFCPNKVQHNEYHGNASVYTDIKDLCQAIQTAVENCEQNASCISFLKKTDATADGSVDKLEASFMYTQILKEILLTLTFEKEHLQEFFAFCRRTLADNPIEQRKVDQIEREYTGEQAIQWYTFNSFLYTMLNKALRMMEMDLIIQMGFFVRDLHNHITKLHSQQYEEPDHLEPFIGYRGQGMSPGDFNQMKETGGWFNSV